MKEIGTYDKANIQTENDYIIIISGGEKTYLDNNGNKIQDIQSLKKEDYPEKIGEYEKVQITLENVYYTKK